MEKKIFNEAASSIKNGLDEYSGNLDDDSDAKSIFDTGVAMHNALLLGAQEINTETEDQLLSEIIRAHAAVTDARFMRGVTAKTQKVAVAVSSPVDQILAICMVSGYMENKEKSA